MYKPQIAKIIKATNKSQIYSSQGMQRELIHHDSETIGLPKLEYG